MAVGVLVCMQMLLGTLFLLGLCLGSFVNALVWRLRVAATGQRLKTKDQRWASADLSILKGRSVCPACGHQLAWRDLLPVLSWLSLRGQCRYCQKPISRQYPAVELLTASLFALSYAFWPLPLDERGIFLLVFWLILLTGLIALAVYDIRWMLLPDKIITPLFILTMAVVLVDAAVLQRSLQPIAAALLGLLFCGGLFYAIFQLSNGRLIGGGDVKLGFLLGLAVGGPVNALLLIFIASLLGSLVGGLLMALGKLKATSRVPFGPFLVSAAVIVTLFGPAIYDWYARNLLLI